MHLAVQLPAGSICTGCMITLHTGGLRSGCTSNFSPFLHFCSLTLQHRWSSTITFTCNAVCACSKPVTIDHVPGEHQKSSSLKIPVSPSFRFSQAISTTTGRPSEPCKFSMVSFSGKTISVVKCGNFKNTNHCKEGDDSEAQNGKGYYGVQEASYY